MCNLLIHMFDQKVSIHTLGTLMLVKPRLVFWGCLNYWEQRVKITFTDSYNLGIEN